MGSWSGKLSDSDSSPQISGGGWAPSFHRPLWKSAQFATSFLRLSISWLRGILHFPHSLLTPQGPLVHHHPPPHLHPAYNCLRLSCGLSQIEKKTSIFLWSCPSKGTQGEKWTAKLFTSQVCGVPFNVSIVQHFPLSLSWIFLTSGYVRMYPKASPPGQDVELQVRG